MAQNLIYIIFAAFGLGFLVFIHELGHYFMALRVGMTVEPLVSVSENRSSRGAKGCEVASRMASFGGLSVSKEWRKGAIEPHQIPDGFGKTPWQRIKVAIMGPYSISYLLSSPFP
jgi:regulator of sigma E protease